MLFLLDTSGSIRQSNFNKVKEAVRNITTLFCNPIHVAVMTFSHTFHLEFCFDCFRSNILGRKDAMAAIEGISYRGGGTYTGGAAKCACDKLLHPKCGMHPFATCIDVVFITDGYSNDPSLKVCDEVKCLHDHYNEVNTHSIGIGVHNHTELECIEKASHASSAFSFESLEEFVGAIQNITLTLKNSTDICYSG